MENGGAADDDPSDGDDEPDLPLAFRFPAKVFQTFNEARGWDTGTYAISGFSLLGGSKAHIYQAEPQPRALDVDSVISYVRMRGFRGDLLIHIVDDILLFEACFLKLARAHARQRTKELNR